MSILREEGIETAPERPVEHRGVGNKAMLEKSVNIRASDYRFSDKKASRLERQGY